MKPEEVKELYYIAPLDNVPSILEKGILSHNLVHAQDLANVDFSLSTVQSIRARKIVPIPTANGTKKPIHDYVNLYFQPCNATLFKIKERKDLCILRIRPDVIKRRDAVVSTTNAAANEAVFKPVQEGLPLLNKDELYAESWHDKQATPEENDLKRKRRCAELLLPAKLHPSYIAGAFVPSAGAHRLFMEKFHNDSPIPIDITPDKFFIKTPPSEILSQRISLLANKNFAHLQDFPKPLPVVVVKKEPPTDKNQRTLDGFFSVRKEPIEPLKKSIPDAAMPANIIIRRGSHFDSAYKTLVNTVNCVGVMGKGVALECKKRYPEMFKEYKQRCDAKEVKLGAPYLYTDAKGTSIINFPTKAHWKNDADIEGIKKGLENLVKMAKEWDLQSVSFPPLGCGNGNLSWKDVGPIMCKTLANALFEVEIFIPQDIPSSQMKASFLMK